MKIKLIKKLLFPGLLALSVLFISCATSVKVDVVRPAELDLNGANSIAILPFRPAKYHGTYIPARGYHVSILDFFFGFYDVDPDEYAAMNLLKSEIEEGLMRSQYLKLISSAVVENAIKNSQPVGADVYLTGEVIYFDVKDKKFEIKQKKSDDDDDDGDSRTGKAASGREHKNNIEFKRYVDMEFRYQIVDSKTDEIISFRTVRISDESSTYDRVRDLPSPYSIIKWQLERSAAKILREIQPYTVTKYLDLLSYSSKHAGMKYADDLADDGFVKESCEKFYEIYKSEGIFEAGYNAALLMEALGDLEGAEKLMNEVAKSGDSKQAKKALRALSDIKNEIKQAAKLEKQNQDRGIETEEKESVIKSNNSRYEDDFTLSL